MATLTQSARVPGPSWDETIVPALRKRLESESRTLAKRMSAVSISSLEEEGATSNGQETAARETRAAYTAAPQQRFDDRPTTTSSSVNRSRPTQATTSSSRTTTQHTNVASASSSTPRPSVQRSRTYSQPYASDSIKGPKVNGKPVRVNGAQPYPSTILSESNRAVSPALPSKATDVKPTRIPKPRTRTTSASSSQQSHQQQRSVNGYNHAPIPSSELYTVQETRSIPTSQSDSSSFAVPSRQGSGILNESPPFKTGSAVSTGYHPVYGNISRDTVNREPSPSRLSSESDERPFEHWYRGEVSRNGGVGELRVAKRMEMLEIANYGHKLRGKPDPIASLRGTAHDPSVSAADRRNRRRKRAGSVSGILGDGRESLYLDDETAREIARVMDEHPPTDLDNDDDDDHDDRMHDDDDSLTETEEDITQFYHQHAIGEASTTSSTTNRPPSTTPQPDYRSVTPTNFSRPTSRAQASRIPTPSNTRKSSDSQPTHPTPIHRGSSEPPPVSPGDLSSASHHTRSTPSTPAPSAASRGKSPQPGMKKPPSASAKTRAKVLAAKEKAEEEKNRKSVAQYPTPVGEDGSLAYAIPTWTQPKPKTGNWDEVVLPVVARKKGLDDHYEQADGSPRAKQEENVVAPAPGTFGYDHSKYRPPREGELIPMDDFGRPSTLIVEDHEDQWEEKDTTSPPSAVDREQARPLPIRRNLDTPPPFAHYLPPAEPALDTRLTTQPPAKPQAQIEPEEDNGGGCCKCVIM